MLDIKLIFVKGNSLKTTDKSMSTLLIMLHLVHNMENFIYVLKKSKRMIKQIVGDVKIKWINI